MKKYLIFLFVLIHHWAQSQPVNSNISNGSLFDGEPFLVINPGNPQNLVVAWMGIHFTGGQFRVGIKTRASFDGGSSWSAVNILPHQVSGYGSADPSMAFGNSGLLYVCYIDYRQNPDSGGIYVARSTDGGVNWDAPSKAFDMYDDTAKRPIDRPWMVVDNSATSTEGTLYITTKPAPWISPPNRNYFKSSVDSGFTWTALANVDGGSHLVGNVIAQPMATPAVTSNGAFCSIYPSFVASQNPLPAYYFSKSYDRGQSINYTTVFSSVPQGADTNLKNGYLLMAHPSDSNRLVFLLPNSQTSDQDILSFNTFDGGQTWTGPFRVNDDALSNGVFQDMVWGAFNSNGDVIVTWRDRRNSFIAGFWDASYEFYYSVSTDNGNTFSSNQALSSQQIVFDSLIAENGNDFMSCALAGDTLYTVWGDTRDGKMNIYFSKILSATNTSIEMVNLSGEENFSIFPNPADDVVSIKIARTIPGQKVLVFDSKGRNILSMDIESGEMSFDTKQFTAGIYFVKIGNNIKRLLVE